MKYYSDSYNYYKTTNKSLKKKKKIKIQKQWNHEGHTFTLFYFRN